ncbi:MAG: HD domain-containing phosphohydrolase [Terriglobales bacterium]
MHEKILFVDDEPAVLEGYKRALHKEFQPDTAVGAQEALTLIDNSGPYAVVVSDMRMPGMDGIQLLSHIRAVSPNTVRVMLTGHADLQSAIGAVNEGHIFRFLTKPCESDVLKNALTTCLVQYRLITAEKDLLENTLMGSIKVLTDVLSLANPAAFGRTVRIRRYVQHLVARLKLTNAWQYEVAAMLSQLGCITLSPELIEAASCGRELNVEEQTAFDMHPSVARKLLSNIPRLDCIAWIIGQQRFPAADPETKMPYNMRVGADLLRVAIAFDDLKIRGAKDPEAILKLQYDTRFDPQIVAALSSLPPEEGNRELKMVRISDLSTGMIIQEEIRTKVGMLLIGVGQEVTYPLIVRLKNFNKRQDLPSKVLVLAPG